MSPKMSPKEEQVKNQAPSSETSITDTSPARFNTIDSAISLTFPENTMSELTSAEDSKDKPEIDTSKINNPIFNENSGIILVQGMPYRLENVMEMGAALTRARRQRMFPPTATPGYNVRATIDDYEDLMRLNAAREDSTDTRDDAFRPDIASLYIRIQRRIQDRDLTHGEVAADSNVRARLSGFANSAGAEASMYNLMRHAMNSVLRLNNLTVDSDNNLVDSVAARVISEIRSDVQTRVARGEHNTEGVDMNSVMEEVFKAIEHALGDRVESQADRLDANTTRLDANATRLDANVTRADNQINAIAGHVNAIDNHVHAMGNNVNAMGALLNSTNGNVTSLTANIAVLQTILSMLPQMVTNAVQDMLPDVIGTAFEGAISNELLNRIQAFANAAEEARTQNGANGRPPSYRSHTERRGWFSRLNIFKKRIGRRGRRSNTSS
ncbi:hypothetical protein F4823DRAFT_631383 [Ustulina deusta]|nr:hypothetical protein F4823DRAFT_631383 [Ustulina deusta]